MPRSNDEANQPERPNALEYARPTKWSELSRSSQRILWRALALLGLFGVFTVVVSFLPRGGGEMSPRAICHSNMREIGLGIAMYANEHGGKLPDDLPALLANGDLDARDFVCPSTGDTPAPAAPRTQATAAGLLQPGHCSYIYLGKGLNAQTVTADTVVLYEPLTDHGGDGMHVLFGDLHVEWVPASIAQTILKQHAASTQPIRLNKATSAP